MSQSTYLIGPTLDQHLWLESAKLFTVVGVVSNFLFVSVVVRLRTQPRGSTCCCFPSLGQRVLAYC